MRGCGHITAWTPSPRLGRREYGEPPPPIALSGLQEEVVAGLPGVCISQGEAAGQPTDPALTSATLGSGGVERSGTAVR